ncbi:MAG TPA: MFS transporter [Hyphomicrobiaceae bacterium]|nr:MFS transporter [Hyphomicrobiaceae bacterium]
MSLEPIVRVWTYRNYALFMGGMAPSLVTTWMHRVGTGWLAWELTQSPTWLGIVAAADLAPMLLLAMLAGAITDRHNPLLQQKIAEGLTLVQSLALALLTINGLMTIELLFVLSLLLGCVHPFASTARHAIVPATLPRSELATGLALDSALFNGSRFVGPALAAFIIPLFGVGGTFVAHVIGSGVFLTALFFLDLPAPVRKPRSTRNILADVGEGLAYIRNHPGIGPMFLLLAFTGTCIRPLQDMLPGFAGEVFHAGAVGLAWLTSGIGIGAMASAASIAVYGRTSGLTTIAIVGFLGQSLSMLGFVATDHLWIAFAFAILLGFAINSMSTSTQALVQSAVDDTMRGRVMSLYAFIFRGMPAAGALFIGLVAEAVGLRLAFTGAALVCLAAWLLIAVSRRTSMTMALERDPT